YTDLAGLKSELAKVEEQIQQGERDRDYKEFQLDQLLEAKLKEGELEELEALQKQLANAEQIKSSIYQSIELFRPMGCSIVQNLKEATNILQKCSTFVPKLDEIVSRLETCRIECKDIEGELEDIGEDIICSPEQLEIVDNRIALLYSLMRKHSVQTVEELIAIREELDLQLQDATLSYSKRDELSSRIEAVTKQRNLVAQQLTHKRE
ncbi:MAG: hypothetical protein J6U47_04030, partial [Bacteroidales bacterium]|nr:hypothetical protein [Bacteroidales bacterium]